VSKPSKPITHRPHEPRHRLRRVHLDKVHVRIRVAPFPCSETEAGPSRERQLPPGRSPHRGEPVEYRDPLPGSANGADGPIRECVVSLRRASAVVESQLMLERSAP
jgi:hypothetical protein